MKLSDYPLVQLHQVLSLAGVIVINDMTHVATANDRVLTRQSFRLAHVSSTAASSSSTTNKLARLAWPYYRRLTSPDTQRCHSALREVAQRSRLRPGCIVIQPAEDSTGAKNVKVFTISDDDDRLADAMQHVVSIVQVDIPMNDGLLLVLTSV